MFSAKQEEESDCKPCLETMPKQQCGGCDVADGSKIKLQKLEIKSFMCGSIPVRSRSVELVHLPRTAYEFIERKARICRPDSIYICNGSEEEYKELLAELKEQKWIQPLEKMDNCWLALTDPRDVARVESRTFISTKHQIDAVATPKHGFTSPPKDIHLDSLKCSKLGNWMSPEDLQMECDKRLPSCMRGRTMYVVPYSMGPVKGALSKVGIELTDSPYVVCSMRIMTRIGAEVVKALNDNTLFVKCLHSVGVPLPTEHKIVNNWPCNPEYTMIAHKPEYNEVISYGSGYGGNSLMGKKCFALRLGSVIAKREGWLAEHMLIMGLTNPQGVKKYIAAAFPSQCGKTNLAMLTPTIPGWKVECVGDDIAWLKFDSQGVLRAINPENGFFGVCPGTNERTNPIGLKIVQYNTIFTNVAHTNDGKVYWEGLDEEMVSKGQHLVSWKGKDWTKEDAKEPAAHPNSRFCAPAVNCPIIDPNWQDPEGVPISAILFGGRRPQGIPLVYESLDWEHGCFLGACVKSETTCAAEFKGKAIMHDPFSMRPFFGYNFGDYCKHWLSMNKDQRKMPKIFHVNWFRKSEDGKGQYLWPGFGENSRVLEWIFNRCSEEEEVGSKKTLARETPLGFVPTLDALDMTGLNVSGEQLKELFHLDKKFLQDECAELKAYFEEYVSDSTPLEITEQLRKLTERVNAMPDTISS